MKSISIIENFENQKKYLLRIILNPIISEISDKNLKKVKFRYKAIIFDN